MTTPYSRVTVTHDTRTVDLAMPSGLPLAELMPRLLALCMPDETGAQPQVWVLGRPGGANLDPARSLTDAGIHDGEVLELRCRTDSPLPAYVEDVRDAVEDAVDVSSRQWRPGTTVGFAIAVGGVALAAVAAVPGVRTPRDTTVLIAAAAVAAALVPVSWWVAERGHPLLTQLVAGVGCLWGGLAGWLAGSWIDGQRPAWLAAAAGALLLAAALRSVTSLATPHLAATGVLAAAAAAALVAGRDPYDAARVLGPAAVVVVGGLPRAALTMGGLAAADYRVRNALLLPKQTLVDRIRQGVWLLTGALAAIAAVAGLAGVALAPQPAAWDRLLAAAIGLGLVLRSRLFSRIPQVAPLRLAGIGVLAALWVRHVTAVDALRPWLAMLTLMLVAALAVVSATPLSDISRARVKQVLNGLEHVAVVAMIALAAGALGIYGTIAQRTG